MAYLYIHIYYTVTILLYELPNIHTSIYLGMYILFAKYYLGKVVFISNMLIII